MECGAKLSSALMYGEANTVYSNIPNRATRDKRIRSSPKSPLKKLLHRARVSGLWYNQLLVIRNLFLYYHNWQVSWLIDPHARYLPSRRMRASGVKLSYLHSLITVTRSYRIPTCFPFNRYKGSSVHLLHTPLRRHQLLFYEIKNILPLHVYFFK